MEETEWEHFRNAVRNHNRIKDRAQPLPMEQVSRSVDDKWMREKLASRGYRNYGQQEKRQAEQQRFGFLVRMKVESIDNIWWHHQNEFNPQNQDPTFLQIELEPIEEFFLPLARTGQYQPDSPYHISLCYTNDLHRFDLYNFENGVTRGKAAYDRLIERYDGQIAHLRGDMRTGSVLIGPRTVVYDPRHVEQFQQPYHLHDDPDAQALISAGKYVRDNMHMTL